MTNEILERLLKHYQDKGMDKEANDILAKYPKLKQVEEEEEVIEEVIKEEKPISKSKSKRK